MTVLVFFLKQTVVTFQLNRVRCVKSIHTRMGTTHSQLSVSGQQFREACALLGVLILSIASRLQSDVAFGEPSLSPVELPQPPVAPLLQHADDVAQGEAQHCSDDVTRAGAEVEGFFGGGRPRGDGSSQQRDRCLRSGMRGANSNPKVQLPLCVCFILHIAETGCYFDTALQRMMEPSLQNLTLDTKT